jgi:excisionase family DNA binding protein
MTAKSGTAPERLLTIAQVAVILGTSERFPRRLVAERRIAYVKLGRHVRIPESALAEFVLAGSVEPLMAGAVSLGRRTVA